MRKEKKCLRLSMGLLLSLASVLVVLCGASTVYAAPGDAGDDQNLESFHSQVLDIARACASDVTRELEKLLDSNRLTEDQLFDTFYIPIPNTSPQKFNTQYDKYTDEVLVGILDSCLGKDQRFVFAVAVDVNGYLPTHNSKFSKPLTDNQDYNTKNNRTKRMFNDKTGITAAKNTKPFLLQTYPRDTGENMYDMSVPIMIRGKHWGAIRIGYEH